MPRRFLAVRSVAFLAALTPALLGCSGLDLRATRRATGRGLGQVVASDIDGDAKRELVGRSPERAELQVLEPDGGADRVIALPDVPVTLAPLDSGEVAVGYGAGKAIDLVRYEGSEPVRTRVELDQPATVPLVELAVHRARADDPLAILMLGGDPLRAALSVSGRPQPPQVVPLNPVPRLPPSVQLADLDGDARLDFVVGLASGGVDDPVPDHLRVVFTTSGGRIGDEVWIRTPSPAALATGDVDGDGRIDVVSFGPTGAWLHTNLGQGWLSDPQRLLRGDFVDGLLTDLDADGRDDVVGLDARHHRVVVRRGLGRSAQAHAVLGPRRSISVAEAPQEIVDLGRRGATASLAVRHQDTQLTLIEIASPTHPRSRRR